MPFLENPANTEDIRQISQNAISFAKSCITEILTLPGRDITEDAEKNTILQSLRDYAQKKAKQSLTLSLKDNLNKNDAIRYAQNIFVKTTNMNSKINKIGNCQELAYLALEYIASNHPHTKAEIISINYTSHYLLVLNRTTNHSHTSTPDQWGENCFFCDPWSNTTFAAAKFRKSLKKHQRNGMENLAVPCEEGDTIKITDINQEIFLK